MIDHWAVRARSHDNKVYDAILKAAVFPAAEAALRYECIHESQTDSTTTHSHEYDSSQVPDKLYDALLDHISQILPIAAALLANASPKAYGLEKFKRPTPPEIKAHLAEARPSPHELMLPSADHPSNFTFALAILESVGPMPPETRLRDADILMDESMAHLYNLVPFLSMRRGLDFVHSIVALQMLLETFRGFYLPQNSKSPRHVLLGFVAQTSHWLQISDRRCSAPPGRCLTREDGPHVFNPTREALKNFKLDRDLNVFCCSPLICGLQMHTLLKANMGSGMAYCNQGACLGTVLHLYNYLRSSLVSPIPILEVLRKAFASQLFPGSRTYPTGNLLQIYRRFYNADSRNSPQKKPRNDGSFARALRDPAPSMLTPIDPPHGTSEKPLSLTGISTLYTLPLIPWANPGIFEQLPGRFPKPCEQCQLFHDPAGLEKAMDILLTDDLVGEFPSAMLNWFAIAHMANDCLYDIVEPRVIRPVRSYCLDLMQALASRYVQGLFLKARQGEDENARLYGVLERRCGSKLSDYFWTF